MDERPPEAPDRGETEREEAIVASDAGGGAPAPRRYALTTWLFGRGMGLVFFAAFVSLGVQLRGLVGERGLVPARDRIERLASRADLGFFDLPTLAWWDASADFFELQAIAGAGCALLLLAGVVPRLMLFGAWFFYLSLSVIASPFTSFQWDLLLLEAGLAGLLVTPLRGWHAPWQSVEPWPVARYVLYLLAFKLMFSSGVVKLASGDEAWASLSALTHHYETQPLPHEVAYWTHQLPTWVHEASCGLMLAIELVVPFLVLVPGRPRAGAFVAFALLQALISATGNYGFFNLLSVVLFVPLLSDGQLRRLVPDAVLRRVRGPEDASQACAGRSGHRWRRPVVTGIAAVFLLLSGLQLGVTISRTRPSGIIADVLGAVRPFRAFGRYGLFAVMTKERPEIVIEGTRDGATWKEYGFRYKPGDPTEAPRFAGLHMPRLDWQMWFAALGSPRRNPFVGALLRRLVEDEDAVLDLLAKNPFPKKPPRAVRAVLYDYRFSTPEVLAETGRYWSRTEQGLYLRPMVRSADAPRKAPELHP